MIRRQFRFGRKIEDCPLEGQDVQMWASGSTMNMITGFDTATERYSNPELLYRYGTTIVNPNYYQNIIITGAEIP